MSDQSGYLRDFLQELGTSLANSENQAAPRFNIFRSLRLKETTATAILKDLLDPKGSHGQGSAFLQDFLGRLRERLCLAVELPGNLESAQLRTEHSTDKGRSIDLTLRLGSGIIALENKIGAGEEQDQVGDYIKFLEKKYPGNWFFVFLTPDERKPTSCPKWADYEAKNQARCLSYAELSDWIASCEKVCKADRVKPFLADLKMWSKNPLGDQMCSDSTRNEVLDVAVKDIRHFRALTTILSCFGGNFEFFDDFAKKLKARLGEKFPATDDWTVEGLIRQRTPTIHLYRPESWESKAQIKIAATSLNDDFAFGVYWPDADCRKLKIQERLDAEFGEGEKEGHKDWPWYQNLPPLGDIEVHRWLEWDMFHASQTRTADLVEHITDLLVRVNNSVGEILSKR